MKKEDLLMSMNDIDDKYIEEAAKPKVKKSRIKGLIIIAACMALTLALGLFLFLPFSNEPDVSMYSDSEYYEIIKQMSKYYYQEPEHKNNFDVLTDAVSGIFGGDTKEEIAVDEDVYYAPSEDSAEDVTDGIYEDVTDNQVAGVIEGDLFKRNDTHFFYLDGNKVKIYSIEGYDSKQVGTYTLGRYSGTPDMYLSEDSSTLILVFENLYYYAHSDVVSVNQYDSLTFGDGRRIFSVVTLDVSDPSNIKQKNRIDVYGFLEQSRIVDGKLYIVSSFSAKNTSDYTDLQTFIPHYDTDKGRVFVSAENIYVPEKMKSNNYLVLTSLDVNTLEIVSDYAFLSYVSGRDPIVYANKDSFYLARSYYDNFELSECDETQIGMSEITRVDYSTGKLKRIGSVFLEGHVNDQYSMDVYNGVLRVFTSTYKSEHKYEDTEWGRRVFGGVDTINANIYCVDTESFEIIASVEAFAPEGENVKSARFDKDVAYVCTSIQLTDPVFMFDLSDLTNITSKDTGTVEGFSTSLVDFGDGYLLGIGRKDWDTPKIEVYKEVNGKIVSVSAVEISSAEISGDYKSYCIDRERGYIGLGVNLYNGTRVGMYIIIKFEDEQLKVISEYDIAEYCNTSVMRGAFVDNFFYGFYEGSMFVCREDVLPMEKPQIILSALK